MEIARRHEAGFYSVDRCLFDDLTKFIGAALKAAIQMEKLGNQLAQTYDVDTLCGYSLGSVPGGMDSQIFQRICAEHSTVHPR
jgi:hypothetical protein